MTHMVLTLAAKQSQSLNLQRMLALSDFLSIPANAVDGVMGEIVNDPDKVEKYLKCEEAKGKPVVGQTKAAYGHLVESAGNSKRGLILRPPTKNIATLVEPGAEFTVTPDVRYSGRIDNPEAIFAKPDSVIYAKPELMFASFLSEAPSISMGQIPSQFSRARALYNHLVKTREWVNKTLRALYLHVGETQREFIASGDPTKMHVFMQKDVASKLNVSSSTVSRLVKGRLALVKPDGAEHDILAPVSEMMPNKNDLYRFIGVKKINDVLAREPFDNVYSYAEISKMTEIPTRTISKYRSNGKIPVAKDREEHFTRSAQIYQIPYFSMAE